MKIILIRHGESEKNTPETIGGKGKRLTSKGRISAVLARKKLAKIRPQISRIEYAPTVQTKQTAKLISKGFRRSRVRESRLLSPIHLGVISGHRVDDAIAAYPDAMKLLTKWNHRAIDISEVAIPEMQDIGAFFLHGLLFLKDIYRLQRNRGVCVVATRSTLVLLRNIILGRTPERGGKYYNHAFDYAQPVKFEVTRDRYVWIQRQIRKRL